jgi:O-antigen/teichoic acid export membrane protein
MNQLKAGALLNYIIIILNIFVGLLYTPYMLRMLGQSEYGLYALVSSVIAYLTVLDLGLGNAIVRYTAKYRAEGKVNEQYEMFGMFLVLYTIIGIVAVLLGSILYFNVDKLFGDTMSSIELSRARIMMLILVFNLAFTFPMSIFSSIVLAYERFTFPKILNIIQVFSSTLIMVLLLSYGYKAIAMVIVQTVFNVMNLVLQYVYCIRKLKIKVKFAKFEMGFMREVLIYSLWIFLDVIMNKIYWSTGQFILGAYVGTVAISVFAVAIQLEGMYMMFSSAISSVFLPKVTGMVAKNDDPREISALFVRTGRIQNIIMSFILFAFIIFGKSFIILWAGKEYGDAYVIALLFFIALYFPLLQNLGIIILQARNQMRFRGILLVVISIVSLAFQILFAQKWGGIGCAIAISAALLLGQGLIMNIYYNKRQSINVIGFWKEIIKMDIVPIAITVIFFVLGYNNIYNTWKELIIGCSVYALLFIPLYYLFSLNTDEKELIKGMIKKIVPWSR